MRLSGRSSEVVQDAAIVAVFCAAFTLGLGATVTATTFVFGMPELALLVSSVAVVLGSLVAPYLALRAQVRSDTRVRRYVACVTGGVIGIALTIVLTSLFELASLGELDILLFEGAIWMVFITAIVATLYFGLRRMRPPALAGVWTVALLLVLGLGALSHAYMADMEARTLDGVTRDAIGREILFGPNGVQMSMTYILFVGFPLGAGMGHAIAVKTGSRPHV